MKWKEKKKRDCTCSKKKHGNPKLGHGPCYGWSVRPTVKERRRKRSAIEQQLRDE